MNILKYIIAVLLLPFIPYKIVKVTKGDKDFPYSEYYRKEFTRIHLTFMPWASAMTIGDLVFTREKPSFFKTKKGAALDFHESVHVEQYQHNGVMFFPRYAMSSLKALIQGKRAYLDNEFEVEAYTGEYLFRKLILKIQAVSRYDHEV